MLTTSSDGTARVWDSMTPDPLRVIARLGGPLRGAAPLDGGRRVLLAGPGRTATLFDTTSRRRVLRLPESGSVLAVAASGDLLATATSRHVTLWSPRGARLRRIVSPSPINAVALDSSDRLAVARRDGTVMVYDRDGHVARRLSGPRSQALSVAFSPDGKRLVVGLAHATAWIWDVDDERVLHILRGHRGAVLGVAFSPDGRRVATASFDHDVRVWDADNARGIYVLRAHFAKVQGAAFSPDGSWVASAGPLSSALFPLDTGATELILTGPRDQLTGVWFNADGTTLFGAGLDGYVRQYDCAVCGSTAEIVASANARLAHLR